MESTIGIVQRISFIRFLEGLNFGTNSDFNIATYGRKPMREIYSKINKSRLLHLVKHSEEFGAREELIDPREILQLSSQAVAKGTKFRAHKHIAKSVQISELTAQESWVVISGRVRATFYDTDDSVLESVELSAGDVSVSLAGGHGYEILEDSKVLEFKTGPYLGQAFDKVFIDSISIT
jgi:mannose-6-phosphate isomerase-like protein (cupin superfamily)